MIDRAVRPVRLGVPAVAVLLLSGCAGGATPGTAAVAGDARLTVEEVQQRTQSFIAAYPDVMSSGVTTGQVTAITVQNFITGVVVEKAAIDVGVVATPTQIDDFITERGGLAEVTQLTSGAGVPPDPALVRGEVRTAILQQAIGTEIAGRGAADEEIAAATNGALTAAADGLRIQVNPRFGTWDGATVLGSSGSLSTTLAELEADSTTTQG